jgi:hypothetical protein
MRDATALLRVGNALLILLGSGVGCRDARSEGDIRAGFPAYCQATMRCEGDNPSTIHHVCMMAPIPFGMMLCEGNNARSVNACVAATETFRNEAEAFGCADQFSTMFRCLNERSTCTRHEFDQSACRDQIRAMTSCVNAASGTRAAVSAHDNQEASCAQLAAACASCGDPALGARCRDVSSIGDDGTCAQALSVVRQTCASPTS